MEITATAREEDSVASWWMEKGSFKRRGAQVQSCEQRVGIWRMRRDMMEEEGRRRS